MLTLALTCVSVVYTLPHVWHREMRCLHSWHDRPQKDVGCGPAATLRLGTAPVLALLSLSAVAPTSLTASAPNSGDSMDSRRERGLPASACETRREVYCWSQS